ANLKKVKVEINGKETTQYVCTRCIRTANKEN
ncbi:MAG TPA: 50S ribosomal protein L28, partial [Candidatus Fimimonas merdipullorum]|nr:50S ribosomal protein L28 [Candidatus Fimimonas merdipullorum]